jgi:hypothetical protein
MKRLRIASKKNHRCLSNLDSTNLKAIKLLKREKFSFQNMKKTSLRSTNETLKNLKRLSLRYLQWLQLKENSGSLSRRSLLTSPLPTSVTNPIATCLDLPVSPPSKALKQENRLLIRNKSGLKIKGISWQKLTKRWLTWLTKRLLKASRNCKTSMKAKKGSGTKIWKGSKRWTLTWRTVKFLIFKN